MAYEYEYWLGHAVATVALLLVSLARPPSNLALHACALRLARPACLPKLSGAWDATDVRGPHRQAMPARVPCGCVPAAAAGTAGRQGTGHASSVEASVASANEGPGATNPVEARGRPAPPGAGRPPVPLSGGGGGRTTHVGGQAQLAQERRENRRRGVATRVFGVHTAAKMPGANQRLASLASQVQGYPQRNAVAAVRNPWRFRARCDTPCFPRLIRATCLFVSPCLSLFLCVGACRPRAPRTRSRTQRFSSRSARLRSCP